MNWPCRASRAGPGWAGLLQRYEQALADFEGHDFRAATRTLANLLAEYPENGPALVLLARAVNALVEEGRPFDPVWELPGK